MESRMVTQYKKEVIPAMKEAFGYTNTMQVPKIDTVVLNVGYGRHTKDKQYIENVEQTLKAISGQKPVHNKASKSISNFKIREGMPIGASVTLRGKHMYAFLDRFIHITLPRVRDFRGIHVKSFDAQGNYSLGLKENLAFPEISADAVEKIHGLEIVIKTTATSAEEGKALLTALGFPFKKT